MGRMTDAHRDGTLFCHPHTRHGHWVNVSTIACQDGIYDSFSPHELENQISALLATLKASMEMKYMDTQLQCESVGCGIFCQSICSDSSKWGAVRYIPLWTAQDAKALDRVFKIKTTYTIPAQKSNEEATNCKRTTQSIQYSELAECLNSQDVATMVQWFCAKSGFM